MTANSDQSFISEQAEVFARLVGGELPVEQVKEFLLSYTPDNVSAELLAALRKVLIQSSCLSGQNFSFAAAAVDVCGTGGDGKDTFNISTLCAITLASLGQPVLKFGNVASTSSFGSSDILELCGYKFKADPQLIEQRLQKYKLCFLHAPQFYSHLKFLGPIRKELGKPTVFNLLGPLCNPFRPGYQLNGTATKELFDLYRQVFAKEPTINASVVHSLDGYDEISLTGEALLGNATGVNKILVGDFDPKLTDLDPAVLYAPKEPDAALSYFLGLLGQQTDLNRNAQQVIAANVAVALTVTDSSLELSSAYRLAEAQLKNGRVIKFFNSVLND